MNKTPAKKRGRPPKKTSLHHHEDIGLFFLDSGAHSLFNIFAHGRDQHNKYDFYDTEEFWHYVDEYGAFVKKHQHAIDLHATVDVIHHPELSWRVLKYLEAMYGINPVPVVHHGTSGTWLKKYIDAGYETIGLGGVALIATQKDYLGWADKMFQMACPAKNNYLPVVKLHGFAMTAWKALVRYPWWSVDSASWIKAGGFGKIFVPRKAGGTHSFSVPPFIISVSQESPFKKNRGGHLDSMSKGELKVVLEWLEIIGIPLGKTGPNMERLEPGVITEHHYRRLANIRFFQKLIETLPDWPWPFKLSTRKGFI